MMYNDETLEPDVDSLLESWAVNAEGQERVVWQVLHDLLTAWARYELMDSDSRQMVTALVKKNYSTTLKQNAF